MECLKYLVWYFADPHHCEVEKVRGLGLVQGLVDSVANAGFGWG